MGDANLVEGLDVLDVEVCEECRGYCLSFCHAISVLASDWLGCNPLLLLILDLDQLLLITSLMDAVKDLVQSGEAFAKDGKTVRSLSLPSPTSSTSSASCPLTASSSTVHDPLHKAGQEGCVDRSKRCSHALDRLQLVVSPGS